MLSTRIACAVLFSIENDFYVFFQVVYVTALLPYALLIVFFIRGLTLPGAADGVRFFVTPNFERLLDSQVG